MLSGAVSEIEYKLLTAVKDIDTNSDDGKVQYLSRAAEIIAENGDIITRDLYIGRISEKYGISRTAFSAKVQEIRKKNYRASRKKEISNIIHPKLSGKELNPEKRKYPTAAIAEETVISVLLLHPDFFDSVYEKLKPEDMITAFNSRIYSIVCEPLSEGKTPDISYFGERLSTEEFSFLTSLYNSEKGRKNSLTVLNDSIKVILDEKIRIKMLDAENLSDDNWAECMQNLIENKKKGKV